MQSLQRLAVRNCPQRGCLTLAFPPSISLRLSVIERAALHLNFTAPHLPACRPRSAGGPTHQTSPSEPSQPGQDRCLPAMPRQAQPCPAELSAQPWASPAVYPCSLPDACCLELQPASAAQAALTCSQTWPAAEPVPLWQCQSPYCPLYLSWRQQPRGQAWAPALQCH